MSDRVNEILSWYGSDNPGTLTNLARLLNAGTLAGSGRLVMLPVDQGVEHGPGRSFAVNPPAYDPRYHFELAIEAGCNAYAAPLGFIEAGAREFAGRVPLILKVNNHDVLLEEKDPDQAITGSVRDALRLGCVAIGFTIYPGSEQHPGRARPSRGAGRLQRPADRHFLRGRRRQGRPGVRRGARHPRRRRLRLHHRAQLVPADEARGAQVPGDGDGHLRGDAEVA